MLLLFIDKTHDNKKVKEDFKAVAKAYQGKISFAYIDGKAHAARKISLGEPRTRPRPRAHTHSVKMCSAQDMRMYTRARTGAYKQGLARCLSRRKAVLVHCA